MPWPLNERYAEGVQRLNSLILVTLSKLRKNFGHSRYNLSQVTSASPFQRYRTPRDRRLDVEETPPAEVLAFAAKQVAVPASELAAHRGRSTNHREHVAELMRSLGCRAFNADAARELSAVAVSLAVDLQAAINRFLDEHNLQSRPFHVDRRSRQNYRRRQTRASNVRFGPLGRVLN